MAPLRLAQATTAGLAMALIRLADKIAFWAGGRFGGPAMARNSWILARSGLGALSALE